MQRVQIPFDGMGKTPAEAAEFIRPFLKTGEEFDFIIPTQWDWDAINIHHPIGGLMAILNKEDSVRQRYNLTCLSRHGQIAVTATPC